MKILVICRENACRSQIAEAYLKFYTHHSVEVHSAGLSSRSINPYTIQVMAEDGIDIHTNRSKSILEFVNQSFDYIISICSADLSTIPSSITYQKVLKLNIPDPASPEIPDDLRLEAFRNAREQIKGEIIRFIGSSITVDSVGNIAA